MTLVSDQNFPFTDCRPLDDISGGSGAKTYLVEDFSGNTFVRKWGLGAVADKLEIQAHWITEHGSEFLCPHILRTGRLTNLFFYDMAYISQSKTMASTLLTEDPAEQQKNLLGILELIYEKSQQRQTSPNPAQRRSYLQEKFDRNLDWLFASDPQLKKLSDADEIFVQGMKFKSFRKLRHSPAIQKATDLLLHETLSSFGHGDLTLSNILFSQHKIYLIDPNPNFNLISPAQEFSKVLQSTFIKYEYLNQISDVTLTPDSIDYHEFASQRLQNISEQLIASPLFRSLTPELVLLHLCIHLCRLLPYQTTYNRRTVYFAEIIKLLSHIEAKA